MAAMTLLSTRGLSREFGGLHAVDNVDFDLEEGEIRAIIGPNGAGKTTFVSLVCGRVPATAGQVFFRSEDISRLPSHRRVRRGIAYTFQITSVFANLSVFDNVALAAQNSSAPGPGLEEATDQVLASVGLLERKAATASTLAYGHQRLLELAMGLALSPRLLILDEPTQGLSDAEVAHFCALVRETAAKMTVLLIEHNMDVVMNLARRITVFDRGHILAEGSPEEIRGNVEVQRVYLGK
jgi:branched-chain amino acid transport system ATP-binding protein